MRSSTRQGKRGFKVAQLGGREVVVEEHQVGLRGSGDAGDLLHFAGADQRGRIGPRAALHQLGSHLAAGARYQLAKLGQRLFGIQARENRSRVSPDAAQLPPDRESRSELVSVQVDLATADRVPSRRAPPRPLDCAALEPAARVKSTPTRTARSGLATGQR